jgi:hypothetical protein
MTPRRNGILYTISIHFQLFTHSTHHPLPLPLPSLLLLMPVVGLTTSSLPDIAIAAASALHLKRNKKRNRKTHEEIFSTFRSPFSSPPPPLASSSTMLLLHIFDAATASASSTMIMLLRSLQHRLLLRNIFALHLKCLTNIQ